MKNPPWRNSELHISSPPPFIPSLYLSSSGILQQQSPGSKQTGLSRQRVHPLYIYRRVKHCVIALCGTLCLSFSVQSHSQ